MQRRITDDLQTLMGVLPTPICEALTAANRADELLEVILDLGRVPTARFTDREIVLREEEITHAEIDYVVARIGEFDADNRAGMERTLHRISAIRNRRGHIVGLTCRVGRAVYGTIAIIQDVVESGKNILLLGKPGIGKTTMLREAARVLAESKRVVIVDTSNEIGGDGDIPHPAIGRARRMQVAMPSLQHEVMIEAVENHNPEVIVIDEIGRELEAAAARTIAERGVQLIGTAHGQTLDNLLLNPTLADLVGGIEAVTLSDEEARRRGTQKTVLERRAPPTFDVLIEIQARDKLAMHHDVASSVDAFLRGRPLPPELRYLDEKGEVHIEAARPPEPTRPTGSSPFQRPGRGTRPDRESRPDGPASRPPAHSAARPAAADRAAPVAAPATTHQSANAPAPIRVFGYGLARNRLEQAAKRLRVPAIIVDDLGEAQAMVTLKSYYRRRQRIIADAESSGLPIYVLRANTVGQMENFLSDLFNLSVSPAEDSLESALSETQEAIDTVRNGTHSIDLPPATAYVRRLQHQMARQANLVSHSYGKEPRRRVRIFRE